MITGFQKQLTKLRASGKGQQITGFHKALARMDGRQYPLIPAHVIANMGTDLKAMQKATHAGQHHRM